jgi:hypothetical protein
MDGHRKTSLVKPSGVKAGTNPKIDPAAAGRIQDALEAGRKFIEFAELQNLEDQRSARSVAFDWDSPLLTESLERGRVRELDARNRAMLLYFDALTWESYGIPTLEHVEAVLEETGTAAAAEFRGDRVSLEARKRDWKSRAAGRAAISHMPKQHSATVWNDLAVQFRAMQWPHLHALRRNGWWLVRGLPTEPNHANTLKNIFTSAVLRALDALGFHDQRVPLEVWLDLWVEKSPHYSSQIINNICEACAKY